MIPRERCTYSAIVDRPPLKLPNQARIVVWTIVKGVRGSVANMPVPHPQAQTPSKPQSA